jgi:hypothetical protein
MDLGGEAESFQPQLRLLLDFCVFLDFRFYQRAELLRRASGRIEPLRHQRVYHFRFWDSRLGVNGAGVIPFLERDY